MFTTVHKVLGVVYLALAVSVIGILVADAHEPPATDYPKDCPAPVPVDLIIQTFVSVEGFEGIKCFEGPEFESLYQTARSIQPEISKAEWVIVAKTPYAFILGFGRDDVVCNTLVISITGEGNGGAPVTSWQV